MSQNKTSTEILDEQKKRLGQMVERRTRAQVRLENEKRALEEARSEAIRLLGTDDIERLRQLYRTTQDENERKVVQFLMDLDEADRKLTDIERQVEV